MSPSFAATSTCLSHANVTVNFSGPTGSTSYTFSTTDPDTDESPNEVILGDWMSSVPWTLNELQPLHRFNLGNTIFIHCPVVYYNYSSMRLGVASCLP